MRKLDGFDDLLRAVQETPAPRHRKLVALCGGPGSGKTTLAADLASALSASGTPAHVLPMDGFHLDNRVLDARDLRPRKGAPETFDVAGFAAILQRAADPGEVIHPVFDRERDCAIAGAGVLPPECRTVVVEGNYLMLRAPGWQDLAELWDISVALDPGIDTLRERLLARWRGLGLVEEDVLAKVDGNDLPNARLIAERSAPSMFTL
jgi:fructokinase